MPMKPKNQARKGRSPTRNKPAKPANPSIPPAHAKALLDYVRETIETELGRVVNSAARRQRELAAGLRQAEEWAKRGAQAIDDLRAALDNRDVGSIATEIVQHRGSLQGITEALTQHRQRLDDHEARCAKWVQIERTVSDLRAAQTSLDRAASIDRSTLANRIEGLDKAVQTLRAKVDQLSPQNDSLMAILDLRFKEIEKARQDLATRVKDLENANASLAPAPEPANVPSWRPAAGLEGPIHISLLAPGQTLIHDALVEVIKARMKFPSSDHLVLALAEEAGELVKAALDLYQGKSKIEDVRKELIQVIGMCVRVATEGDPTIKLPSLLSKEPCP